MNKSIDDPIGFEIWRLLIKASRTDETIRVTIANFSPPPTIAHLSDCVGQLEKDGYVASWHRTDDFQGFDLRPAQNLWHRYD